VSHEVQEERNKAVIREFTRIFKNQHNVDGVGHLFDTKSFIHHFRDARLSSGFEGLRQVGIMMNGGSPTSWSQRRTSSRPATGLSREARPRPRTRAR